LKKQVIKLPTFSELEKEKISATPKRRKEIQDYLDWMYWGIKKK
jgi:hypothetical protein